MRTLRDSRLAAGMSQTQTAGAARINVATLSQIETGRLRASENQARKIAQALGVALGDVTEFAMLADNEKPPADAA